MNYKFDFVSRRKLFFSISIAITVLGIATLLMFGLRLGVDFQSGTTMDITTGQSVTNDEVNALFEEAGTTPSITVAGDDRDRVNARFSKVLSEEERKTILAAFYDAYGEENVSVEENTVDAEMAREFGRNTILYVGLASLLIALYVIIRFEWRFAVTAIVALFHDAFIVISLFSIFRLEVNLTFVAAVLTIIGYSINDTIVIFDRIRENLRFAKIKTFEDLSNLVNTSIWQTLTRSINTMLTVLVVALGLFLFGSESIRLFSLAMLLGLISGAYSSIFIASQLWILLKYKSIQAARLKAAANANG